MAGINLSQGWSLLKNMIGMKNGTPLEDVTNADVEKFLKEADLNNDGKVTQDEFERSCKDSSDYKAMEEKYIETFKKIAELDKIAASISDEDIAAALEQLDETPAPNPANGNAGLGGTTGVNPAATTPPVDETAEPTTEPETEKEPIVSSIPSVALSGSESAEELRAGRSETLAEISNLNEKKTNIKSSAEYKAAESTYTESNNKYNESLNALNAIYQAKVEANEELTAEEQAFVDANTKRDEAVSAVSEQEGVIDSINGQIDELDGSISDTQGQLDGLEEPSTDLIVPIYDQETGEKTGEDRSAYEAALAKYNAQKTQLEAQKADLEDQKTEQVNLLAEEEAKLSELQEDVLDADTAIADALKNLEAAKQNTENVSEEELTQIQTTQQLQSDYVDAWQNLFETEQKLTEQINTDIERLRENLNVYDDAIAQKDAEQQENLPEGMHSRNGFVYDGEGENERLMLPVEQSADGPNLPAGYKVDDETGNVVDSNGNIVGKVQNDSTKDINGDGVADDVQSIFLYADEVANGLSNADVYGNIGNGDDDTFTEYLEVNNIDINNATQQEINAALVNYKDLMSQKYEFIRLYNQIANDENLSVYLESSHSFLDSTAKKGVSYKDLDLMFSHLRQIGAVADSNEQKISYYAEQGFLNWSVYRPNDNYNIISKEALPQAIDLMNRIIQQNNS